MSAVSSFELVMAERAWAAMFPGLQGTGSGHGPMYHLLRESKPSVQGQSLLVAPEKPVSAAPSPRRPGRQGPSGCAFSGSVGRDCSQEPRLPGIPFKELASLCHILVCNYLDDWYLSASSEDCLLTTFVEFLFSKRIFFQSFTK